jgi:predicted pyridoxine 5'-phosphate oxidase superfamily flavin-nucleotide-binding protein
MTSDEGPNRPSPWHDGERAMQARAGVAERMARVSGRAIRDFMPDQHRDFFAQLPFIVVGSVDRDGWVWASLLAGRPGFATSPDPRSLTIAALPVSGDPLACALMLRAKLGLLGIELPTRRRNRLNGSVVALDGASFTVAVEQSFGNCPQYIQARDYASVAATPARVRVETFNALDAARVLSSAGRTLSSLPRRRAATAGTMWTSRIAAAARASSASTATARSWCRITPATASSTRSAI